MSAPIRVLAVGNVYPPHHLGGYEIIWRGAMDQLRAAGHQVRVLTTAYRHAGVSGAAEDPDVHRVLDWYWHEHEWRRLSPRARFQIERHNAGVFEAQLAEFRPDVVTWWPLGGLSLGLIERARRNDVPGVFFILDPWPAYGPIRDQWIHMWRWPGGRVAEALTGLPTRIDYAGAGRWIFCSETMREQTLAEHPEIADHAVLRPGVQTAFLGAEAEPEPPSWNWQLLYAGRVVEQKGVATAIEALPLLPASARLRIVGEGDSAYRQELERLASELGVNDRLSFEPARSQAELVEVYRAADAIVFPVLWAEPWGLVPLEAMALGRPVLATGRGGSGEYLEHETNSLLFEAGNAGSLAHALRRLADDAQLLRRLREGGRRTAERHSESEFNDHAAREIEAVARR